jgi:hypothetical protein
MSQWQVEEIRQTLGEVAAVRARARAELSGLWFPSVLFGGLTVTSAAVAYLWGGRALGWYWPIVAVLGSLLTFRFYRRRERDLGLSSRAAPYVVTAGLMLLATMALAVFGTAGVRVAGPPLAVSIGYLVFAALSRTRWLVGLALGLAAVTLGLAWLLPLRDAVWLIPLVYGSTFVIAGVGARAAEERPT